VSARARMDQRDRYANSNRGCVATRGDGPHCGAQAIHCCEMLISRKKCQPINIARCSLWVRRPTLAHFSLPLRDRGPQMTPSVTISPHRVLRHRRNNIVQHRTTSTLSASSHAQRPRPSRVTSPFPASSNNRGRTLLTPGSVRVQCAGVLGCDAVLGGRNDT
jgi:hypothetical protein